MKKVLIRVENLNASYDKTPVLQDINLTLHEKDYLGIIGPNGGGKTTLIKCILGLKKYDSGSISFFKDGHKVDNIIFGYLPQYTLIDKKFPISVSEVILSGLSSKKKIITRYSKEDRLKATKIIQRMGLVGLEDRAIGELSGGQLQRVILGRSLIAEPDVLILDEPSTYIDKKFEAELYQLLQEIQKECAIILISHDISTTLKQANCVAAVNITSSYRNNTSIDAEWLEKMFECPIELLGFGKL